jgi:hypothetical protein
MAWCYSVTLNVGLLKYGFGLQDEALSDCGMQSSNYGT